MQLQELIATVTAAHEALHATADELRADFRPVAAERLLSIGPRIWMGGFIAQRFQHAGYGPQQNPWRGQRLAVS